MCDRANGARRGAMARVRPKSPDGRSAWRHNAADSRYWQGRPRRDSATAGAGCRARASKTRPIPGRFCRRRAAAPAGSGWHGRSPPAARCHRANRRCRRAPGRSPGGRGRRFPCRGRPRNYGRAAGSAPGAGSAPPGPARAAATGLRRAMPIRYRRSTAPRYRPASGRDRPRRRRRRWCPARWRAGAFSSPGRRRSRPGRGPAGRSRRAASGAAHPRATAGRNIAARGRPPPGRRAASRGRAGRQIP